MRNCILALATIFALGGPVAAQSHHSLNMRTISSADLNLHSAKDQARLQSRLLRAARNICSTSPVMDSIAVAAERKRCVETTLAQIKESRFTADSQIASR